MLSKKGVVVVGAIDKIIQKYYKIKVSDNSKIARLLADFVLALEKEIDN